MGGAFTLNSIKGGEEQTPQKKQKKNKNKFLVALSTVLVVIFVALAVLLVGVRVFGLQVYTVLSGSMEPTYHTGSLIYVKSVDYKEIQPGQVITFMLNEDTVATHRVVEVIPDEKDPEVLRFRTKGDANDVEDGTPVHYKNVLGTPVFTIPYLGYLSAYIQKPPGIYVAVAAAAVALIIVFLPDLLSGDSGKKSKKNKKEQKAPQS